MVAPDTQAPRREGKETVMTEERRTVDYERIGPIVTIAMNRPEKLNAVSDEMVRQLMEAFRRFDADPDAYVAIFCGRGRAFCSGADVHQRQLRTREELEQRIREAIEMHLEGMAEDGLLAPEPSAKVEYVEIAAS